jgi:hypothetical protein
MTSCITCDEFDIKKLILNEFKDFDFNKNQFMAFPDYLYDNDNCSQGRFVFETGWIQLTQCGFCPQLGSFGLTTDEDRQFIHIPFDKMQPSCVKLHDMMEAIDDLISNCMPFNMKPSIDSNKMKQLYTYRPIIKKRKITHYDPNKDNSDSDEYGEIQFDKRCKFNFLKSYPDKKLLTKFNVISKSGKTTPIHVSCMSDLDNYIKMNATVRIIATLSKIRADKVKNRDNQRIFATQFTILRMDFKKSISKGNSINIDDLQFKDEKNINRVVNDSPQYNFDDVECKY